MKSRELSCDPELATLVERAKVIEPVPDVVRARILARARAVVATAEAFSAQPVPPARHHRLRFAVAALVAFVIGAASAAAALRRPSAVGVTPTLGSSVRSLPSPRAARADSPPALRVVAAPRGSAGRLRHPSRSTTAEESYAAEIELLQRAQAAYASRSFAVALALLAEHGRLFPKGRLAEEREALRVRSLARSGRPDDARRVAAAFAERFPRSVLLQQLQETPPFPE